MQNRKTFQLLFILLALLIVLTAGCNHKGTTAQSSTDAQIVYATRTGKCYHMDDCRSLSRSKIETTVKQAKEDGYRPCHVCDPPE